VGAWPVLTFLPLLALMALVPLTERVHILVSSHALISGVCHASQPHVWDSPTPWPAWRSGVWMALHPRWTHVLASHAS
jgi:hypothetical protein